MIDQPGVYDIPAEAYHADPVKGGSLSSTGARGLLNMPPARWLHERDHPQAPTPAMVFGTAVHSLTLGTGPKVVRVDAEDYRTKAAKDARDAALVAGDVPLLRGDFDKARAMAEAVLAHEVAGALFDPARGKPEQTLVWRDIDTGIWRRSMVDHLPHAERGRPILADLKTTVDASPRGVARSVAKYGYHQQGPFYLDGYEALFPGSDAAFLFVFVEKDPPHLVAVYELDAAAAYLGGELNRRAIRLFAECQAAAAWPGYSPEIEPISLPAWAHNRLEEL